MSAPQAYEHEESSSCVSFVMCGLCHLGQVHLMWIVEDHEDRWGESGRTWCVIVLP